MSRRITYMLRRTLCPWNAPELVAETVAWAKDQLIDEIMWISESSGMYKELPTLDAVRENVERLRMAKQTTEAEGIIYSINPLTTIGHGEYGNDVAAIHPGLEMMVDFQGGVSRACACPLGSLWRGLMKDTFSLYASTRPARLWLEDDFRYFNHGPTVRFGCYCPRHLEAFSRRAGQVVTREELVRAVLRPGAPHPWRGLWLDLLEETLAETAAMIRHAVHAVSPSTELGWMSTNPGRHEIEGRRVATQMTALAGQSRAAIRMTTTHFAETGLRDLLIEDEGLKKMVPQLPQNATRCTEIETCPHSPYATSAARIAAQIEWACVLGVPNHTLNIFDYIGSPLAESPAYDETLRDRKDEFAAFAHAFDGLAWRGVGLPGDPASGRKVQTEKGADMTELMTREGGWADPLRAFGAPVHFSKDEAVTAVTGQGLVCMSLDELEAVFSRGVLLDASALMTLQDMGRADLAGVRVLRVVPPRSQPIGPEELTHPDFAGGAQRYTWGPVGARLAVFELLGAQPISRIVDTDGQLLFHGAVIHQNALGGRVASFPWFCQGASPDPWQKGPSGFFYTARRRQQFHALLPWLGKGFTSLLVHSHGWTLPHRADGPGRVALAAMNVTADTWPCARMTCSVGAPVRAVEWLDITGARQPLAPTSWKQEDHLFSCNLPCPVPPWRTIAALLQFAAPT